MRVDPTVDFNPGTSLVIKLKKKQAKKVGLAQTKGIEKSPKLEVDKA